jgi:hypothetical protein
VPLPVPLPPDVIAMNGELLMAVHEQPGEVVTLIDTGPPARVSDIDVGFTAYEHVVVCTFRTTSLDGALVPHAFLALTRT